MQILTQQVWGGLEVLQFSQALDDAGVAGPGTTLGKAGLGSYSPSSPFFGTQTRRWLPRS